MTKKEIKKLFQDQLLATRNQIDWVLASQNEKVLANRIGILPSAVKRLILGGLMPLDLRDEINKKYPGHMEIKGSPYL